MDGNNNGTVLGKLSFIFGIVGMVCSISICCSGLGFPFGVAALVLGIIGKNKDSEDGKAKLGFIFGIICLALALIGTIVSFATSIGSSLMQYVQKAGY